MLTPKQVEEIKEHLNNAQNPLFFFDNDADGLCSFLLLQRYLGRGKGIPVKSYPSLDLSYFRKVSELNTDYVFILDVPKVSDEFLDEIEKINLPVVWIDHHGVQSKIPDHVSYYDPALNKPSTDEPVTALCYQVTQRKEDLWLAVVGSISDKFVPEFYPEFEKLYPDLAIRSEDAFEIYYNSRIGEMVRLFNFALKDRVTNVIAMLNFLKKVKTPYETLEETNKNKTMHKKFQELQKKFNKLVEKASKENTSNLLFFEYGGEMSMSTELANILSYKFPKKVIVVAYLRGAKSNISIRGKGIKKTILKILKDFENSRGGGHENALGAQIMSKDLSLFKEKLANLVM